LTFWNDDFLQFFQTPGVPSEESLRGAGTLNRMSSSINDTSGRFEILPIASKLIHGAADCPPGGPGPVFLANDLYGLIGDDARGLGRRLPYLGIGGQFLCRVAGDITQNESHGGSR
jgi:hypothetical protein